MKKTALILVLVLLLAVASGCISEKSSGVSSTASTGAIVNSTGTTTTSTPKPRLYSTQELLDRVSKIEEFTYFENTSMELHLVVRVGNLTQDEGNVTVVYRKVGYVDLKDREAAINITTITFPGGARTFSREIIKNGEVYIFTGGTWRKLTNETFGINVSRILNVTWEYNAVSLAEKYLRRTPTNVSLKNGTELLYFPITESDLMAITSALLGRQANVSINVTNGILELRFRNGTFVGGRLGYRVEMVVRVSTPSGTAEVHETGYSYDEFVVTDINVKKPVHVPASYRA
ncbi:hypothetical protein [Thermococcus sp.]|uniref:hypothetical protein n=1 Tax=Thermococcus sp. TaxID=35749 RepID=UPI00260C0DA2|nr:hypothetical protein [Thermococcus sp.]